MSGESLSSSFFTAVSECSANADSESRPPLTNGKSNDHRTENRKPFFSSSWRPKSSGEEKPTTSTNWRDRSQPRVASSAFSSWRGGARKEESTGVFQRNDIFSKKPSSTNPFGERRHKLSSSPTSSAASSRLPGCARKTFGDSRNKFGSNSSIASDCSTSSVQPGDGRKPRKKFGSSWSVASDSSTSANGRGFSRGGSSSRGRISNSYSRTERVKSTRYPAASPKLSIEYLEVLSQKEIHEIILEVTFDKSPFDVYLQKSPLESDWLLLILSIVAKICASDYEGNCSEVLDKLCKSPFLDNLSNYLGQMTTETDPEVLIKLPTSDLCELYSSLLEAWPTVAVEKNLRKLIAKTKIAVRNIPLFSAGPVDEDTLGKLEKCLDIFDEYKKMFEEKQLVDRRKRSRMEKMANRAPPDDFRRLSLYPTSEDLFQTQRAFIRPNIIKGAYENVEHYLDVQFRLLREDFVDSVRSGIQKYLASMSESRRRFKFDNVRIYPDTRILSWEQKNSISREVGVQLNFDPHYKFAWDCDWEHNKRFMHGSLLLLTSDDFNTFTCATVLERDLACLRGGFVLAGLVEENPDFHKIFAKPFTMAESEVFFEPYFLIMQALRKLDARSFPMPEYIVGGQAQTTSPLYPQREVVGDLYMRYSLETHFIRMWSYWQINLKVRHLVANTVTTNEKGLFANWDDDSDDEEENPLFWEAGYLKDHGYFTANVYRYSFNLDVYQMEAYDAGMNQEFCIIQGPPGTGKTFLGLKLVDSILNHCRRYQYRLPILIVCLTNHALDQFLERILAFTSKIVRVGGQSRKESLSCLNLRSLRRRLFHLHRKADRGFQSMTSIIMIGIGNLGKSIEDLQKMKKYIEMPAGVVSAILLQQVVDPNFLPVVENDATLLQWLLEDNEYETPVGNDLVNFGNLYENDEMGNENPEPGQNSKKSSFTNFDISSLKCVRSYSITLAGLEAELQYANEVYNSLVQTESSLLEQGYDSSSIYHEKAYLKNKVIKPLTRQYRKLKANLETFVEDPDVKVLAVLHEDPYTLPSKLRWLIYWSWLAGLQRELASEIKDLETRRQSTMIRYDEYKMFEDLHIMKQADIVGMTTTGAARLNKLLTLLKPAIVVVEEAAEVLETHIVASLTKSCRHLILIGDHKQLRPSAAVYELSKHYNIDVSLFERMINNGMHCPMLKVQHRMRPEISALITPLIYPDLKNHESVMSLEPVEGVRKNMFFLEHNMPEAMTEEETSKENIHEAEFVVKLAIYLVQQGYSPERLTLLTFYAGQMFRIRNIMKSNKLVDVKCVVVDNYQGEENDIIILSLVRSNKDGNIGFLKIENRVCVALSRAKNGFFMVGNMDCLAKHQLWQKLCSILKKNDAIGREFPLYCVRHDKVTLVSKAADFHLVSDGGCGAVCEVEMKCGHSCPKMCHPISDEHESVDCEESCKKLCPRNHECRKLCKEECGDCVSVVEKLLPCQHVARVRCHVVENEYLCTELVEDVLLSCDHTVKRKCHQKLEDVSCTKLCGKRLSCNHTCTRLCHDGEDPYHAECKKPCEKYYEGCKKAHVCQKACHEECGRCPFKEDVNLPCGHTLTLSCSTDLSSVKCPNSCLKVCPKCNLNCTKRCWENCHPCTNKVRKVIPTCGHEIDVNCSDEPDQKLCQQKCQLMAPCGHKCQLMCGETCDSERCLEWVTSAAIKPICGHENIHVLCGEKHKVFLRKPESFLANCREPCDAILECGDVCSGTCGECLQGRLHQTCPKMCGRTFICGHRCKAPCRKLCPPCNEPCSFRCSHSKCNEKCGIPCSPCKKPCEWKCKHTKCRRKCGDICNRQPCNKPCELKLPCGHDCIGFCGEPCPQQCRFCNPEVVDIVFGYEDEPDARFVLMVDCGHVIESRALDLYFSPSFKDGEIVLKGCPLCGTPIKKTLRYMNFVKGVYQQIAEVNTKNFEELRSFELTKMYFEWRMFQFKCSTVPLFFNFAQFCTKNIPDSFRKHTLFSSEVLSNFTYFFQVCQTLIPHVREFGEAPMENKFFKDLVIPYLDKLVRRLQLSFSVNRQIMLDFNLELRRYHLMVEYQLIDSVLATSSREITGICDEIKKILFGSTKFTQEDENKIKSLFDELRTRRTISSEIKKKDLPKIFDDLKAGSWFQCLNGHYYCVGLKENVTNCPECVEKGSSMANQQSSRRRKRRGRHYKR